MYRFFLIIICLMATFSALSQDEVHTRFLDLPLSLQPDELVEALMDKGLQHEERLELSGRIAGLDIWLYIDVARDSSHINSLLLTSQEQQGHSLHDDFVTLMKWMQRHYGKPTWQSTIRSHPFARWYVGFDRDIVLIATASAGIEIWFYENHKHRNIDYYAILKYCERNPAEGVPQLSARECVTWKSSGDTSYVKKKKVAKRTSRKATKSKRRAKSKKAGRAKTKKGSRTKRRSR